MATITKDPISGAYKIKEGDTLNKIATTQGRTLEELIATNPQYASNPNMIRPGDVVLPKTVSSPSPTYQDLTTPSTQPRSNNPVATSFTDALIRILKDAQQRDATGQGRLMKQSQDIKGKGITDANSTFKNTLLAPSAGTSLGLSAPNQFDPLTLSIENQQKLATKNLDNITDVVKETRSAYEKEQDRKVAAAKKSMDFDTEAETRKIATQFKQMKGPDNYIDPYEWMAARELWGLKGGSDSMFESNFKRYLNPESYKLAGYKELSGGIENPFK